VATAEEDRLNPRRNAHTSFVVVTEVTVLDHELATTSTPCQPRHVAADDADGGDDGQQADTLASAFPHAVRHSASRQAGRSRASMNSRRGDADTANGSAHVRAAS